MGRHVIARRRGATAQVNASSIVESWLSPGCVSRTRTETPAPRPLLEVGRFPFLPVMLGETG